MNREQCDGNKFNRKKKYVDDLVDHFESLFRHPKSIVFALGVPFLGLEVEESICSMMARDKPRMDHTAHKAWATHHFYFYKMEISAFYIFV